MKVWTHHYTLHAKARLNSRSSTSERHGVLLRFEFRDAGLGHADLFPWPELGDLSLEEQLHQLRSGILSPQVQRALHFARLDAIARAERRNLLTGLPVPRSHFLISDLEATTPRLIERAVAEGFERFKIKLGRSKEEIPALLRFAQELPGSCRLRLDFNAALTVEELFSYLDALRSIEERIDFVEDPLPASSRDWSDLKQRSPGLSFALDRDSDHDENLSLPISTLVIKPATQRPEPILENARRLGKSVVFTSSLDHPIGQLSAAYEAALANRIERPLLLECGLLSHGVYETNAFSEDLRVKETRLLPAAGTGWGFDELLNSLEWAAL